MRHAVVLPLLLLSAACGAEPPAERRAEPPAGPWALVPGERFGPLSAATGESELLERFGPDSVSRADVAVAEGEVRPGTLLFPGTADEVEILWHTESFRCPELARALRAGSRWTAPGEVRVGSTLREVEEANGAPFTFWGFEWELGGYVMDWGGGALSGLGLRLSDHGTVVERGDLVGPVELRSDAPEVRGLDPEVAMLFLTWQMPAACGPGAGG